MGKFYPRRRRSGVQRAVSAFWNNTIFNVVRRCALSPAAVSLPPQHGPPQHEFNPAILTSPGPKTIKSVIFNPPPQINGLPAPPHFVSKGASGSFGGHLEFFACPVTSPEVFCGTGQDQEISLKNLERGRVEKAESCRTNRKQPRTRILRASTEIGNNRCPFRPA